MVRLVVYLLGVFGLAAALVWLADNPGSIQIEWQGYTANPSVFQAVIALALLMATTLLLWSIIRQIWQSPATIGSFFLKRRNKRGLESLSSGMIAIGAGDRALATRYAIQARKALPNEPLTHLLRAQAAQLSGDRQTSRRIFDAMLSSPDTEQLGLRGLFLEAEREGEAEVARQYAERALALNPKLGWSADALFDLQCRQSDWSGAQQTLALAKRHGHLEKAVADRRRAVLLTAQAQAIEDSEPDKAMALACEAHGLARDLIPAAGIAARILAARGNTQKAAKIIQRTWARAPHPDLATAYAYARIGDSPRDRLTRIRHLANLNMHSIESPIAVATAAIEAREWAVARHALTPLLDGGLTQRVCTLMAKIEGGELGDAGRVREWLARAVNAPRDPVWTADGVISDTWAAVSPATGQLDAFQWRVPVEIAQADKNAILGKLEELVALGARVEVKDGPDAPIEVVTPVSTPLTPSSAPAKPAQAEVLGVAAAARVAAASPSPKVVQSAPPPVAEVITARPSADVAALPSASKAAPDKNAAVDITPLRPLASPSKSEPLPVQKAAMAEGVLRTVRASAPSIVPVAQPKANGAKKPSANVYVAPHAPDDPGPDDADPLVEEKRPYMVPFTRPAKQRS